jgi:hypothetical protein
LQMRGFLFQEHLFIKLFCGRKGFLFFLTRAFLI